ncbi:MAG TPA: TlyA family RNA methyltransferase [Candidatus Saccharimonadia bacterium]|nr:TlyA family RNA methyltransferase [Candidatus Saccharimonadia bacterium]
MKKRLDDILIARGWADDKAQARALVMSGRVTGGGRILDKPGYSVAEDADLQVRHRSPYVSRAGEKLASVAESLSLDFRDKTLLDVGSSTGGFTDFALQHGARKVFAVDVGRGQLSYKLRQDPRVASMERTDIRNATLPELCDMAVVDVSFISLTKVLEPAAALLAADSLIAAMAKPQFEATRAVADKWRGVIPMGPERDATLESLREWIADRFKIVNEADSRLPGAEGNVEHFFLIRR